MMQTRIRCDETDARAAHQPYETTELLHVSDRTRVTRMLPSGGGEAVVRKEPLGAEAQERLRHETAILRRLTGIDGVVQLSAVAARQGSIMLADGGACLASQPLPMRTGDLIDVALRLARALAAIHRRGVIHRDINPANIVRSPSSPHVRLIDFALATTFAETRPEFAHHNEIVGTLAYLAPEQTGRMGRPVDHRADLYALGATLYELATGAPPFRATDPLRLCHEHLARVPVPPAAADQRVPPALSDIIMHLLEKEPDNRYQSADGLIHDLVRLVGAEQGTQTQLRVGAHDFPPRLLPPSRLIGRDSEAGALGDAFADAMSGRCRGVLISGEPGVGKTSLIDELRPLVTASGGWFVTGKFDQYRRDQEFDGVRQALRQLGRMLLAEPEDELADLRERMRRSLGPNAGLVAAVLPEFATLLRVPPAATAGEPLTNQERVLRSGLALVRSIVSRQRPVAFVVDDLQWAGRTPLGFVDLLLSGEGPDGLLLVGAYRDADLDPTHQLTTLLSRWQQQPVKPKHLHLENLSQQSLTMMVADMLRLDREQAASLTEMIAPRTTGNPYDTVELLSALRHDGVLRPGDGGWRWDAAALRRGLRRRADTGNLLVDRLEAMPSHTLALLESMACLAGRIDLSVLEAATGLPAPVLRKRLGPALNDGLLVVEPGEEAVRFRHDRIREAVLRRLDTDAQRARRLRMARRLGARPDLFVVAADQYQPIVDDVRDPRERRLVVDLLRRAADQAKLLSNHTVVEAYLAAAARLIDPADSATLIDVGSGRHAALYSLGRLAEADEVYQAIDRLCPDPVQRADATRIQVSSLTNQGRAPEAVQLGVELLRQLGVAVPTRDQLNDEIERGLDDLYRWVAESTEDDDLRRPDITDPALLARAALINRLIPPAFISDQETMAWLTLETLRMWAEHGPGRTLLGPIAHTVLLTAVRRQDYRTGHQVIHRVLSVGEARGYEPETAQVRFLRALGADHWFEPLENTVSLALHARERLIHGADPQYACWTYYLTTSQLLDSAPTLDSYRAEVDAALAFAGRTGNQAATEVYQGYQRLVRVLRGEPVDAPDHDVAHPSPQPGNGPAAATGHITRALAAALLDDPGDLVAHSAAAMPMLRFIGAAYPTALAYLLRALALAGQARAAAPAERGTLLAELDAAIDWLAARAADAPSNFQHMLRLAEAERAWVVADYRGAAYAFDMAQRDVAMRRRPWHRALIAERAARFYLAHGMDHAGYALLDDARRLYRDWGATAKSHQLDWAYPTVLPGSDAGSDGAADQPADLPARRSTITTGTMDLRGIFTAAQALSSETSVAGLRARVAEVLGAMTGASGVQLLLRDEEHHWVLPAPAGGADAIPIVEAGRRRMVPVSAVRYAERTREALVVSDATRDDRFARDPYLAELDRCSLLIVPIISRGSLRALLLLENRFLRGAFSADRLGGVMLIAGQLAVSLDNAMVYTSLERKVAERTRQLAMANRRLELLSVTDPLTGLANRRRLEEVLSAEWRRAQRSAAPISLAMVDIDDFKLYNDHYGHPAGDACLERIAERLRQHVRPTDLVARYGGEEFAIVMPNTDIGTALDVADRVRNAVLELAEPHPLAKDGIVTVSVGVAAAVPPQHDMMDCLVGSADVELYRAKRGGRNRVSGSLEQRMLTVPVPARTHLRAGSGTAS